MSEDEKKLVRDSIKAIITVCIVALITMCLVCAVTVTTMCVQSNKAFERAVQAVEVYFESDYDYGTISQEVKVGDN